MSLRLNRFDIPDGLLLPADQRERTSLVGPALPKHSFPVSALRVAETTRHCPESGPRTAKYVGDLLRISSEPSSLPLLLGRGLAASRVLALRRFAGAGAGLPARRCAGVAAAVAGGGADAVCCPRDRFRGADDSPWQPWWRSWRRWSWCRMPSP